MTVFAKVAPIAVFTIISTFLVATSASAAVITAASDLSPTASVITFDEAPVGTGGPLTIDIVTINAPGIPSEQIRAQGGLTQTPDVFEGNWFGFGTTRYTFDFSAPISQFGVGVFDPSFPGVRLEAYDANGALLETAMVPTGPTQFSTFIGFSRSVADIFSLTLFPAAGDSIGIDNVTYSMDVPGVSDVPLPAALPLFLAGLGGLGVFRRHAKK